MRVREKVWAGISLVVFEAKCISFSSPLRFVDSLNVSDELESKGLREWLDGELLDLTLGGFGLDDTVTDSGRVSERQRAQMVAP